jgi:hypothetical protein
MKIVNQLHSLSHSMCVLAPLSFGEGPGVRLTAFRTLTCHIHIHFHFHFHSKKILNQKHNENDELPSFEH